MQVEVLSACCHFFFGLKKHHHNLSNKMFLLNIRPNPKPASKNPDYFQPSPEYFTTKRTRFGKRIVIFKNFFETNFFINSSKPRGNAFILMQIMTV